MSCDRNKCYQQEYNGEGCETCDMAIESLKEQKIIHCKDCKYWIRTRNKCGLAGYLIGERGYCIYGKEGEKK